MEELKLLVLNSSIFFMQCGPDLYSTNLAKSLKQLKVSQKNCTIFLREIAIIEADRIKREIIEQNKK